MLYNNFITLFLYIRIDGQDSNDNSILLPTQTPVNNPITTPHTSSTTNTTTSTIQSQPTTAVLPINTVAVAAAAAAITNPTKEIAELKVTVRKLTDKLNYMNQVLLSVQKQVQVLMNGGSVGSAGGGGGGNTNNNNHHASNNNTTSSSSVTNTASTNAHTHTAAVGEIYLTDILHNTSNNNTNTASLPVTSLNTLSMNIMNAAHTGFEQVEYNPQETIKSNRPPKKRHLDM